MRLTRYGRDVILKVVLFTIILDVIALNINIVSLKLALIGVSIIFFLFTLYFFRDPNRKLPSGISANTIVSPADGKVVLIDEITNEKYDIFPKGVKLKLLSIFLSPLDVHVNRIPMSGKINFLKYIKGEYIVAFNHKSSDKNERTEIGIINNNSKQLIFKQIAGYVARRIVYELKLGDEVNACERFGMIKFGSRIDFLFDVNAKVFVKLGAKVKAGETIIGELC